MLSSDKSGGYFHPCGCLINSRGAHRGDCPDFETVRLVPGTNRIDEMTWKPRAAEQGDPDDRPNMIKPC